MRAAKLPNVVEGTPAPVSAARGAVVPGSAFAASALRPRPGVDAEEGDEVSRRLFVEQMLQDLPNVQELFAAPPTSGKTG